MASGTGSLSVRRLVSGHILARAIRRGKQQAGEMKQLLPLTMYVALCLNPYFSFPTTGVGKLRFIIKHTR